jgi:hypothetical protein
VKKTFQKFSSIHPSIHLQGCFSLASSGVACRSSRATEEEFAAGARAGGLEGTTHCDLASAGGIFAMQKMKFPFLLDSLFLLPSAKFIAVFTGLFLVTDSSKSAGVQEVRGERESRRIFSSSSSNLLLLLRLWQATNRENFARIEDVQVCAVTC